MTKLLASLPMYDLPELTAATDDWWRGLARAFRRVGVPGVPAALDRGGVKAAWGAPGLLFGQTCGYPFCHEFAGKLALVATPAYGAQGCQGAYYCSHLVVRADEAARDLAGFRGRHVAVNAPDSQSGYNVLRALVAPLAGGRPFFGAVLTTGSHVGSLAAVKSGRADLCAVDCVTYALLARVRPRALTGLRVLMESPRTPGLPYVTAAGPKATRVVERCERLRDGLAEAFVDPALAASRQALLLEGYEVLTPSDYRPIAEMERRAVALGYPELS